MVEEISECFLHGGVTIEKEDLFDPVYPKNISIIEDIINNEDKNSENKAKDDKDEQINIEDRGIFDCIPDCCCTDRVESEIKNFFYSCDSGNYSSKNKNEIKIIEDKKIMKKKILKIKQKMIRMNS